MEGTYEIICAGEKVGHALVKRQGLYWVFDCRCRLTGEHIYRLQVSAGTETVNLGIFVPDGDHFTLRTRVPVKQIPVGDMTFRALAKHPPMTGIFVPLSPEEPFRYLQRLKQAHLERRGDTMGAVLPDKPEAP